MKPKIHYLISWAGKDYVFGTRYTMDDVFAVVAHYRDLFGDKVRLTTWEM